MFRASAMGQNEQSPSASRRDADRGALSLAPADTGGPGASGPVNAETIRRIWREHRRWVAAILLAHKPREADVEDLLQAVAVQVVRKIGDLRDPDAVRPWLRTVAINAARAAGRDATRSRKRLRLVRERAPAELADKHGPTGDEAAASMDEARRLMDLARTLPEGYREPLLMRCVRGMSYRQIGEVLDLPETTIETRIARGRRMLRELAARPQAETAPGETDTTEPRGRVAAATRG